MNYFYLCSKCLIHAKFNVPAHGAAMLILLTGKRKLLQLFLHVKDSSREDREKATLFIIIDNIQPTLLLVKELIAATRKATTLFEALQSIFVS